MQGTQYAPRESILCMEHFVALQSMPTFQCCFFGIDSSMVILNEDFIASVFCTF